ncbi:MAG: LysR family transcriptional regulator [Burkholderiales bacterium]
MSINFDLGDLRAFVAVAELSSFRAAAETIHLSQPALSRRIDKLEEALGVRLFDRDTRNVELTAVGRDFARKARALMDDLDSILLGVRDVAANRWGQVTLASIPSTVHYFLPAVLRRYHERFPRIRVRIIDDSANEVLSAVVHGEAELGLNMIGSDEPTLDFEPLLSEPFVAACRRDHPLARQRSVTWAELTRYDFMTVDKASGNRLTLDLALATTQDRPQPCFESRHVSTLVGFVESGLGVAAVPRLAMPRKGHPLLASVPIVDPEVTRTVGIIKRRGRSLSPAAQHLYDMLRTVAQSDTSAPKPAPRATPRRAPRDAPAAAGARARNGRPARTR